MRKRLAATALAAVALLTLTGAAWAQDTGNFGCSNASLRGEYAFGVTAYTPPGHPNGPPEVVTGIKVFDGNGTVTQRDYQGDNLAGPDFAPPGQEVGTYQVNPDCTGSMVINLSPPHATPGSINIRFVISNGGRHIHEVVSQFTPPNSSGPAPAQTSGDDWKVAAGQ